MRDTVLRRIGGLLSVIIIVVPGPGPGDSAQPTAAPAGQSASSTDRTVALVNGRGRTVNVTDAGSLVAALAAAQPGETIQLAEGNYAGRFTINTQGQQGNPTTLRGSKNAVINGGDTTGTGYDLHLDGANYWQLVGFTVNGGQKGIMTDRTNHTVLSGLTVGNTGQEAVHFGNFSSDNVLQNSVIHDTGKASPQFGEGLYFGTAKSNWAKKSGGQPDRSNNNKAIRNSFRNTTAENIDVKEETSGGVISGNAFDGSAISGANFADSVLDVKGVGYQIVNNVTNGASPNLVNGFQTHVITDPSTSGCDNTFQNNVFNVQLPGPRITLDRKCGVADGGTGQG